MILPTTRFERAYSLALRLYPAPFREAHAVAMLQAFRDAAADASLARHTFISLVLWDLIVSVAKENVTMVRESFARPVLIFNALALSGIATGVALALYAIPQHVLRSGLNDPQIQLASDLVAVLERGDLVAMLQQGTLPAVIGGSGGVDRRAVLHPLSLSTMIRAMRLPRRQRSMAGFRCRRKASSTTSASTARSASVGSLSWERYMASESPPLCSALKVHTRVLSSPGAICAKSRPGKSR